MEASIAQRDFLHAIRYGIDTVETKSTIPILTNLLLIANKNNTLTIRATDLDIMVESTVSCDVIGEGTTSVPAKTLKNIIEKCNPDSEIKLIQSTGNEPLKVRYGRSRFTLQALPGDDFPEFAAKDMTHSFEVPVALLTNLLKRAEFCISNEETRYYLNGVFFHHIEDNNVTKLCAAATDGHRLAKIQCDAPEGADKFGNDNNITGIILPRKTIKILHSIIKNTTGLEKVGIQVSASKVVFTAGDVILSSKIIDGQFPDYDRVIPKGNDKKVTADRVELLNGIDRLSTIASERGRAIKLALSQGILNLSITNVDTGAATEEVDVEYTGDPMEVGFNSSYMVEILKMVEGDKVEIALADPGSPALISGVGQNDAVYVAMPMRV